MTLSLRQPASLRRRLVIQLLALFAVLSILIYVSVRIGAARASEATLDSALGAAVLSMAEEMRGGDDGVAVDLSPVAFSMLAAMGEERIFYRIDLGSETLTGYADLPAPGLPPTALSPVFYDGRYRGDELRFAAVSRRLVIGGEARPLLVVLAQTREGQRAIAEGLANRAAALALVVFLAAIPVSLLAAGSLLRPIGTLADAVGRRGPRDLRPVRHPAPEELSPFITALNGFIARLRGTLSQTETFIAEAAHHVRTPLSVMRAEAELALRHSEDGETRARLRRLIRAADDCARSAGQLLDHATVLFRADQHEQAEVDLAGILRALARRFAPMAEMRDIRLSLALPAAPLTVRGDAVMIEAALRNLLDNAVKYSPDDTEVALSCGAEAGEAVVRIADRGRGVPPEDRARVLERFERGQDTDDVAGSGLGLTIVAEAAAAMGGRFSLDPREGGGTCALLALPLPP